MFCFFHQKRQILSFNFLSVSKKEFYKTDGEKKLDIERLQTHLNLIPNIIRHTIFSRLILLHTGLYVKSVVKHSFFRNP